MRIAVITLVQGRDFPTAWSSLEPLNSQLVARPDRRRWILWNDLPDRELTERLRRLSGTEVLEPGRNLGVARGRNALIRAALDWSADLIVSLDDDLYVPSDYLDRLQAEVEGLLSKGSRLGIVGPTVLDFHEVAPLLDPQDLTGSAVRGDLGETLPTATIRASLLAAEAALPQSAYYHMGIRDWRSHYLVSWTPVARRVRGLIGDAFGVPAGEPAPGTELRRQAWAQALVADPAATDPQPVDTLPGGACAYTRQLVEDIGLIDERFSPFGFEDSDFSIRAVEAGFENLWLPGQLLLHDLQHRLAQRSDLELAFAAGKAFTLLAELGAEENTAGALLELLLFRPIQALESAASKARAERWQRARPVSIALAYSAGVLTSMFQDDEPADGRRSLLEILTSQRTASSWTRGHRDRESAWVHGAWRGLGRTSPGSDSPPLLPYSLRFNASLTATFHRGSGSLQIRRLRLDVPGLADVSVEAGLTVPATGEPSEILVDHLHLSISDLRLLEVLERLVSDRRGSSSVGAVGRLLQGGWGEPDEEIVGFVRSDRGPARLDLTVSPPEPLTLEELSGAGDAGAGLTLRSGLIHMRS